MTNDPITWTGTPDDQRAEWRGMVAIVKRHAQNGALYCGVGTIGDVASLFHSADCMLWPEYPVTAKWLCELVMRHEAAKADLERWKRRAALWKRAAKAQMDERRDVVHQCVEMVMENLGVTRKGGE